MLWYLVMALTASGDTCVVWSELQVSADQRFSGFWILWFYFTRRGGVVSVIGSGRLQVQKQEENWTYL